MTKEELIARLQDIEWEDFEAKEAAKELPKNIWETVSAFSNSAGGWIVLGVKQNRKEFEIAGIANTEKIEQDFLNTLRSEKFNVKIRPKSKKYTIEHKTVLAFYIPVSDHKPVYYNNPSNSFIRAASGDQKASKEEIDAMYRDQRFGTETSRVIEDSSVDFLHKQSVEEYREYLKRLEQSHPYNRLTDEKFLAKLRIVEKGKLTYGGLLFFGSNEAIQKVFNDFRIDYLEIPGTTYQNASVRYTYRIDEQENIWQYFFALFRRISSAIDVPFQLTSEGFATENQPQVNALREALVNLLMHTDYFSVMKPRIRAFTDRIEFLNPGALPQSLEKIRAGDLSLPRNPIIAKLFRMINLAENAGYGFDKMEAGWVQYSDAKPVFEQGIDYTKAEFYFPLKGGQKGGQKGSQKGGQKMLLSKRQKEVLELINNNPFISRQEMAEILNINVSALRKHLDALRKKEIIEREGPDRGGYWKILIEN